MTPTPRSFQRRTTSAGRYDRGSLSGDEAARTEAAASETWARSVSASAATGAWWSLRALYAILIVSAVALVILVLRDVVATLEADTGGELHDLFVFDLAWPVFLIAEHWPPRGRRRRADRRLTSPVA